MHNRGGRIKRLLMTVRGMFFWLMDALVRVAPHVSATGREQILLVRLDRIGDFLLWLDAARAFRELYPADRYELTLLGHPSWASLASELPVFDQVWTLDPRRFVWSLGYRLSKLAMIRRHGFSTVVQVRHSRELLVEDALTRVSGAGTRLGLMRERDHTTRIQKFLSDRWYTRLVSVSPTAMELERNAQFMRGLGLSEFRAGVPRVDASGPSPVPTGRPYYVLFPGASWCGKQWPLARFAEVAARLHQRTGWDGVICGGPGEEALGGSLISCASVPLQNFMGRTSLQELAAVIAGARLVVSNDTSGVHMAAAVGTPSVCILGGGHYGRFLPYRIEEPTSAQSLPLPVIKPMSCFGCDWHCIYPVGHGQPVPCIDGISVAAVWGRVQDLLDQSSAASPERVAGPTSSCCIQ